MGKRRYAVLYAIFIGAYAEVITNLTPLRAAAAAAAWFGRAVAFI